MRNFFLVSVLSAISFFSKGQGIHAAIGSGTEWVRLEVGYSLSDQIHAGVRLCPGFNSAGIPSYYAGYFRKTFQENDLGWSFVKASYRGYIGASAGLIQVKGNSTYDIFTGNVSESKSRSAFGFSGDAGVEILYGSRGKIGSFFELNLGQVPNAFNKLDQELSNVISGNEKETKLASIWGFGLGLRVYFGK